MPTIWGFHLIENKHSLYRRKDCMRNFFLENRRKVQLILKRKKCYR